jgi:Na+-transporting methylmalonyl-CoA/oxaloacetate decarboxylase gamma subunit/uncharacterized membrane protein
MRKADVLVAVKREVSNVPSQIKKPYIEMAALLAAIQLAMVVALYLIGHGAAITLVGEMGAQSRWYVAEPSTMISDGAFICVNGFFEHIEVLGWWFLLITCVLVLVGALTLWGVSEPRKLDRTQHRLQNVILALQRRNVSVRSWSILGRGLYALVTTGYAFVFLFVLFTMIWSSGALVGREIAKDMREHWTSTPDHSSSPRFITITTENKVFCGMHIVSSPRGHIVWNGKSALLLPFDSTSFEAKCAVPPKA